MTQSQPEHFSGLLSLSLLNLKHTASTDRGKTLVFDETDVPLGLSMTTLSRSVAEGDSPQAQGPESLTKSVAASSHNEDNGVVLRVECLSARDIKVSQIRGALFKSCKLQATITMVVPITCKKQK